MPPRKNLLPAKELAVIDGSNAIELEDKYDSQSAANNTDEKIATTARRRRLLSDSDSSDDASELARSSQSHRSVSSAGNDADDDDTNLEEFLSSNGTGIDGRTNTADIHSYHDQGEYPPAVVAITTSTQQPTPHLQAGSNVLTPLVAHVANIPIPANIEAAAAQYDTWHRPPRRNTYQIIVRIYARDHLLIRTLSDYVLPDSRFLKHAVNILDGMNVVTERIWPMVYIGLLAHDLAVFNTGNNAYGATATQITFGISRNHSMYLGSVGPDLMVNPVSWIGLPLLNTVAIVFGVRNWMRQGLKLNRIDEVMTNPATQARGEIYIGQRLEEIERKSNNFLSRLSYQRWSHGLGVVDRNKYAYLKEAGYWLLTPFLTIPGIMFYYFNYRKVVDVTELDRQLRACGAKNGIFIYLKESGNYLCVACDWPNIPLSKMFDSQGCLDGLLASDLSQAMKEDIIDKLDWLGKQNPLILNIDLSKQNWMNWPIENWRAFLNKLAGITQQINAFKLGRDTAYDGAIAQEYLNATNEFLQTMKVNAFNGTNLNLGVSNAIPLNAGLAKVNDVDVSGNQLDAIWCQDFQQQQPKTQKLRMRNNRLDNGCLDAVGKLENLQVFDAGDQPFPPNANLTAFGERTANRSLVFFKADNARLTGRKVLDFMNANKRVNGVDFSHNLQIRPADVPQLVASAHGSNLTTLLLNDVEAPNEVIAHVVQALPSTPITHLGLAGSSYNATGFRMLTNNTQLVMLDASSNMLGPQAVDDLEALLKTNSTRIMILHLSDTQLDINAGMKLCALLAQKKLRALYIGGNNFKDEVAKACSQYLPGSGLIILDLQNNQIALAGAQALADVLPKSDLQQAWLNRNNIPDNGVFALLQSLLTPTPNNQQLGTEEMTRNEANAEWNAGSAVPQLNQLFLQDNPSGNQTYYAANRLSVYPAIRQQQLNMMTSNTSTLFRPSGSVVSTPDISSNVSLGTIVMISAFAEPLLIGVIAFYLIFRAARAAVNQCCQRRRVSHV